MAKITLKKVPEKLHASLLEQAQRNNRSLSEEAMISLNASIFPHPQEVDVFLERVQHSRTSLHQLGGPLLDDSFLHSAREEGRA